MMDNGNARDRPLAAVKRNSLLKGFSRTSLTLVPQIGPKTAVPTRTVSASGHGTHFVAASERHIVKHGPLPTHHEFAKTGQRD